MSEHIGFRCPDDIIAAIKHQIEASGKGRTEVLVEMLRASMQSVLVSDRGQLPSEPAVYFVWGGQRLLYIGRTGDLRKRFVNHHKLADFVLAEREARVSWLPATTENLIAFESSLIEELEPELNRVPSDGKTTVVSFRLSDAEIARLEAMRQSDDESFSQIARRLLEGILDGNTEVIVQPPEEKIKEIVDRQVAEKTAHLNVVTREMFARLEELEGKLTA